MNDEQKAWMDEIPTNDRLPEPTHPRLLLQAREASGLQLAALAAILKVPVRKLEALESGRYEDLPDLTFARALASSACRHLKVDPAPILNQIPVTFSPLCDSLQTFKGRTKTSGDLPPPSFLARARLSFPWLILTLLLLALVLYIWPSDLLVSLKSKTASPLAATKSTKAEESNTSAPAKLTLSDFADGAETRSSSESVGTTASDAATAATSLVDARDAAPSSVSLVASLPAVTPESSVNSSLGEGVMNLTSSGDSWVEVTNGQGQILLRRMLKVGESVDLSSVPPYTVVIGRADMVQVMVRGRPLDITPYARNSVARFEVR